MKKGFLVLYTLYSHTKVRLRREEEDEKGKKQKVQRERLLTDSECVCVCAQIHRIHKTLPEAKAKMLTGTRMERTQDTVISFSFAP